MGYVCVCVCFKTLYGGQFTLPTQLKIPSYRDRAEGGAGGGGALTPPLFCKNKNKLNKK